MLLSKHLSKNLLRLTWENKGPSRGFLLYYSLSTVSLLSSFASPFLLFKISTSVQPTFVHVIQMRLLQITWDLLRATAFLDFLELVKIAVVMTFLGCDFKAGYVMQFASFEKLKSVFASFGPGFFEEFRN